MDSGACFVRAPGHEPIVLLQRKTVKGLQMILGVSKEDASEEGKKFFSHRNPPKKEAACRKKNIN